MSGIITAPRELQQLPANGLSSHRCLAEFFAVMGNLSATTQGTVTSLFEIGALFGSLATMIFGNQLGRIRVSFISSIFVVIGAVLQASSYGVAQIVVGRIVTGLGIGGLTSTAPVYLSECTKAVDRGADVAKMLTTLIVSIVGMLRKPAS